MEKGEPALTEAVCREPPAQEERCKGLLAVPAHLGSLVRTKLQKNKLPPRELRIPGIQMREVRIPEAESATGIKNST